MAPGFKRDASKRRTTDRDATGRRVHKSAGDEAEVELTTRSQQAAPDFSSTQATAGGITIPQHIVIPPSSLDSTAERKYQIQSEITISYDPKKGTQQIQESLMPPPEHGTGSSSQHSAASSVHRRPAGQSHAPTPMSIMSNV